MTGPQRFRQDDEHLASRLRRLDPARNVAPLPEHRIEEIVMNSITTPDTAEQPHDAVERNARRRRLGIVAALAGAAAAAAIVTAVVVSQPAPGGTLALSLAETDGIQTACIPIAPEWLAESEVAFEGRVTGIDGSTVTLEVLQQYSGEAVRTATIPQGTDDLIELTIGRLELGGTYLISATDGVVMTCGFSGPSTPELKAVYEEAFS